MVDSQSTSLIHLATSISYPAKDFFFSFSFIVVLFILTSKPDRDSGYRMPLFKIKKVINYDTKEMKPFVAHYFLAKIKKVNMKKKEIIITWSEHLALLYQGNGWLYDRDS